MATVKCEEHSDKDALLWCITCEKLICPDCLGSGGKHRTGNGHDIGNLDDISQRADELFRQEKQSFNRCKLEAEQTLRQVQMIEETLELTIQQTKEEINTLADTLVDTVNQYREQQLQEVECTTKTERQTQRKTIAELETSMGPLQDIDQMIQDVTRRPHQNLLLLQVRNLMRGVRSKVSEANSRVKSQMPQQKELRLLHHALDAGNCIQAVVQRAIGAPYLVTPDSKQDLAEPVLPEFTCCSAPDSAVLDILPSTKGGNVFVAYSCKQGEGLETERDVAEFSREGRELQKKPLPEGQEVKMVLRQEALLSVLRAQYSEETTRRQLDFIPQGYRVATPPVYILQKIKIPGKFTVMKIRRPSESPLPLFDINVSNPRKIVGNQKGTHFAILHRPHNPVQDRGMCSNVAHKADSSIAIFRKDERTSRVKFQPPVDDFCLTDVCFAQTGRKEVLLVSDSVNNCIYETDYMNGFRMLRTITSACGLMVGPTALAMDDENKLWIGCKGGQILSCHRAERPRPPVPARSYFYRGRPTYTDTVANRESTQSEDFYETLYVANSNQSTASSIYSDGDSDDRVNPLVPPTDTDIPSKISQIRRQFEESDGDSASRRQQRPGTSAGQEPQEEVPGSSHSPRAGSTPLLDELQTQLARRKERNMVSSPKQLQTTASRSDISIRAQEDDGREQSFGGQEVSRL